MVPPIIIMTEPVHVELRLNLLSSIAVYQYSQTVLERYRKTCVLPGMSVNLHSEEVTHTNCRPEEWRDKKLRRRVTITGIVLC